MKRRRMERNDFTPKAKPMEDCSPNKLIFTKTFPIIGEVPISFFIPESKSKAKLQKLIEEYGGIVINAYEPFTYQVKIEKECRLSKHFYEGDIYTSKLIHKSIERGKMISSLSSFKLGFNQHGIPHNNISRKPYTFLEAAKIFEIISKCKDTDKLMLIQFWKKVEEK